MVQYILFIKSGYLYEAMKAENDITFLPAVLSDMSKAVSVCQDVTERRRGQKMYKIHAELDTNGKFKVESNLFITSTGNHNFYTVEEIKDADFYKDIISVVKRYHGICISRYGNKIGIYNDPFATIPIYFYSNNVEFVIDSLFEVFKGRKLTIDHAGCYETLMYESGLFDRTPFCEIKELPSASKAEYDLTTGTLEIKPYWDYSINCVNVSNRHEAIDKVWSVLLNTYKNYSDKSILMGISGGLDSRLSACLLKEVMNPESVNTFTFGHYEGIKDYRYAKDTCKQLGFKEPVFFRLSDSAYKEGMVLPEKTGGVVGIQHCHAWYCLNHSNLRGKTLISNYYSDGVMGYDCRPTDAKRKDDSDYYRILTENRWNASLEILEQIRGDLDKITGRRSDLDNYSGFNEYIYLTERNPKFHIKLSYLYSELLPVELPFATYELLQAVISLPQELRYYKKIEHLILAEKFGDYADVSSTRYAGFDKEETNLKNKIRYNAGFIRMRVLNGINAGLKVLTNGNVQVPNPYITENHLAVFDRCFRGIKHIADESLKDWIGLDIMKDPLEHKNCRTSEAEEGFKMVSLYMFLHKYLVNSHE